MKFKKFISTILFFSFLLVSFNIYPCHITFDKDKIEGFVGDEFTVTVTVKWEHRKCVLDEYDINIDYNNVQKVKESDWKKIKRGLYQKEITFKLTKVGKGSIKVWRECSKKGESAGILEIITKEKPKK